jgi:NADPH-dependent ferric siderophore reductase
MSEQLISERPVKPVAASVRDVTVAAVRRVSPGFLRLTLRCDDPGFAEEFDRLGHDQWFRLFLPNEDGVLDPPYGGLDGWYGRWNAQDPGRRAVIRNYTIRDARFVDSAPATGRTANSPTSSTHTPGPGWEIDVDFVLHRSAQTGEVEGVAAGWALTARPGDRAAILDQGRIFNPADRDASILIIADESGLPGVEGIVGSLGERPATCLLEVPDAADRRELGDVAEVRWVVREPGEDPGHRALPELDAYPVQPESYVYIVGEASFMLAARDRVRRAGVGKDRLDFCAYWRRGR